MTHRAQLFAAMAFLAACAPLPGVDRLSPVTGGAVPSLVPLDALLAGVDAPAPPASLSDRVARLRARAAQMHNPPAKPAG